jgi:hypothetical protein
MKLLIINHNFQHDIESLCSVESGHEIRVWSARRLGKLASSYFPKSVFSSMLGEEFSHSQFAKARKKYSIAARTILHNIYKSYQFDCIISPSDTVFYLRAWVDSAHELGMPFIVLQKETSISPYTMIEDAREIGRSLPFIGDLMLVCSDHHKQFWLNAGADGNKIIVTGQPRFDFYARPDKWMHRGQMVPSPLGNRVTILFFSYDLGAYSRDGVLAATWLQLRSETEEILVNLAKQGFCNVIVKPHPQQQEIEKYSEHLSTMSGDLWGNAVQLISGEVDARQLILAADAIVGFQTTALFEALAAGKFVIYTFWSDPVHKFVKDLLPFHEMQDTLTIASSPESLKKNLLSTLKITSLNNEVRQPTAEILRQLGPLDGHASERCLHLIGEYVNNHAEQFSKAARTLRKDLDSQASGYCKRIFPKIIVSILFWRLIIFLYPAIKLILIVVNRFISSRRAEQLLHKAIEHRRNLEDDLYYCRQILKNHQVVNSNV